LALVFFTSPAAAVAKYCDEYVCLSVCLHVSVSVDHDIFGTTHNIFTSFSVHVAYGHGSVLDPQGDEIPRGGAILWVSIPINNAL